MKRTLLGYRLTNRPCGDILCAVMMLSRQKLLQRAQIATRESKYIDFKREFDPSSAEAWCEVIKDIAAFANSGGGIIIFGVADDGSDTKMDATPLLAYDTADITNRIARYTNYQFCELEVVEIRRGRSLHAAFLVSPVDIPMIFAKPGTYDIGGGRQKTAFAQGTIYFRHGSKSEHGNRDDLSSWRDREVERVRKSWMGGIRKVVERPPTTHSLLFRHRNQRQRMAQWCMLGSVAIRQQYLLSQEIQKKSGRIVKST